MTNPDTTNPEQSNQEDAAAAADRLALEDLDAGDDADKVIGGKTACPCMGGEIHSR
jgi:hypothetical protein